MDAPPTVARFAFVCAMPMELTPLAEQLSLEETQVADVTIHAGKVGEHDAVAIVTGMGTELARRGTERLLEVVAVEHVVVVGITGAVDDETPIGTLILPEAVVHRGTGSEHRPTRLGDGTHSGKMATGDDLLTDLDAITALREAGVVSLDMETAAIALLCEERGIPWSVFRVISDRATDGSVTEEIFRLSNQDGTANEEAIKAYFENHPERLAQLAKLAEGATLAAETAAEAAIDACLRVAADDLAGEDAQGEVPEGLGPEVFREQLRRAARLDPEDGAHVTLRDEGLYLADIESVEPDDDGHRSRITLRNGVIIAGVTGAAIVAALATIRFRRRRSG